jgi:hypothetical protein
MTSDNAYQNGDSNPTYAEKLRGTQGARFEGVCKIARNPLSTITCFCRGRDKGISCLLLIKGSFCFIFATTDESKPMFAIPLYSLEAKLMPPQRYSPPIVHLQTRLGDTEYEVTFDNLYVANDFITAVDVEAAFASIATIQNRLGHGNLTEKSDSVDFAETIGEETASKQPSKPVPIRFHEMFLSTIPPP